VFKPVNSERSSKFSKKSRRAFKLGFGRRWADAKRDWRALGAVRRYLNIRSSLVNNRAAQGEVRSFAAARLRKPQDL
jgi:hypothetical protein